MADETPVALPSAPLIKVTGNASLQPPLTRRGDGPGLIIVVPGPRDRYGNVTPGILDPLPQKKWAEEGYAVVQIISENISHEKAIWDIQTTIGFAIVALGGLDTCSVKDRYGLIVYGDPSDYSDSFISNLRETYAAEQKLVGSITFTPLWGLSTKPQLIHSPGESFPSYTPQPTLKRYFYPSAHSADFILPCSPHFNYSAASVSHTRSLTFLRPLLNGPFFDLEAIWDEHTAFEFATRSVAQTMGTMVDEPYVNHIPVLTGGMGREALTKFYRERFIHSNPKDVVLELVSRTVGVDRVVDEFVATLTHDRVVDWLLPGIPPTNKHLRIPVVSVVNIRGDRLYHEHIHWDQGTTLSQLGLLPDYLPFPYALPDGRVPSPGKRFEYRLPVTGAETAAKLENGGAVESNGMFEYEVREVDDA
ncbi:hypothetical protein GGS20DRAFT_545096 [Poronia punctata]|nr:hypothetical protein GGS20DRAFT_545096 [Poronia punctata]